MEGRVRTKWVVVKKQLLFQTDGQCKKKVLTRGRRRVKSYLSRTLCLPSDSRSRVVWERCGALFRKCIYSFS